jgi:synaptic vesicle membrane protein VAT-1
VEITEVVLPRSWTETSGLRVAGRALAAPGPGQVQVRVEAAGVSFDDMLLRRGTSADQPAFPLTPGRDVVGTVVAVGDGAPGALLGQRVAALTGVGGWASGVNVEAQAAVIVPDGLTAAEAAALAYPGVLAWWMLHGLARVRAGQTIVVPGAPGWVGTALVQLAVLAGASVIGVSSSRQLAAAPELGFAAIDHWTEDVPARVAELAPGGVDAVFDAIGGPNLAESLGMLGDSGILVSYGNSFTKDEPRARHLSDLAALGGRVVRADVFGGSPVPPPEVLASYLGQVLALAASGQIRGYVAGPYRFPDQVGAALADFEQGGLVGRVVLTLD